MVTKCVACVNQPCSLLPRTIRNSCLSHLKCHWFHFSSCCNLWWRPLPASRVSCPMTNDVDLRASHTCSCEWENQTVLTRTARNDLNPTAIRTCTSYRYNPWSVRWMVDRFRLRIAVAFRPVCVHRFEKDSAQTADESGTTRGDCSLRLWDYSIAPLAILNQEWIGEFGMTIWEKRKRNQKLTWTHFAHRAALFGRIARFVSGDAKLIAADRFVAETTQKAHHLARGR